MNSALAAMLGLTLSIILIVKKVSPVYSLILGALIGGLLSGWGLQNTVTEMISGIMEISPAIIRNISSGSAYRNVGKNRRSFHHIRNYH